MFRKIRYTWAVMGASWNVLNEDKELLLFPVFSAVALILVTASFIAPLFLTGFFSNISASLSSSGGHGSKIPEAAYYAVLFLFYFCNYFVITFFNTAIVASAIKRLSGGEPSFGYALSAAASRLPQILGWALVSATVGLVLRLIEDRSERLGRLVAGLLGAAWSVTTFLVVPILVVEKKGPVAAFKRSLILLKSTWGEQVVGGFGFGMIFALLTLPCLLIIAGGIYSGSGPIIAASIGVTACYVVALALIQATLQTIFQAAVYVYATGKTVPAEFSREMLAGAMMSKK